MRQQLRRLVSAVLLTGMLLSCAGPQEPLAPEAPQVPEAPEVPEAPVTSGRWDSAVWDTSAWGP
jgi:hypothetical protein